jgi:hypothetical protein
MMWPEWKAHIRLLLEEGREADEKEGPRPRGSDETPLYPEGPPLPGYGQAPSDAVRRRLPGYTDRPDMN